jgi:putative peptidoglycan lipid II flippase
MIFKNSILLGIFSFLSVLLGIFRDRLLATTVGVGPVLDIYNAAFRFPDFLYALSLAFVTAGTIVPFLTIEDKNGNVVDSRHKLSSVSLFFAGCISLLAIVIAITLPLYARYVVPGFTEEQVEVFISVTRLMLIQPMLLGITSLISCFAQLKNHFILYGVAPLGYSSGVIFGIVFLYPAYGVHGLIYGVLLGATLSLGIQAISLRKAKMMEVFPYFSFEDVKEVVRLGFPRTGVNVLTQGRIMFFTAFATTLGPGMLSSYLFAQRITEAVTQIIQQSVTTASLPVLSKEFVEHRIAEYKSVVRRYVMILGSIGIIASYSIYMLQDFVIEALYGKTNAHEQIAYFLMGFLIILPFNMMIGYISIGLYSMKDTKSVLVANVIATTFAIIVCYTTKHLGMVSLLYGVITMAVLNFLLLGYLYLHKKIK